MLRILKPNKTRARERVLVAGEVIHKQGLSENVALDQKPEWRSHSLLGEECTKLENSKCKGPEVELCLACSRNRWLAWLR